MALSHRKLRDLSLLLVCMAIFAVGLWMLTPARQSKVTLRLTAGSQLGTRHALALQLKDICRTHQIELQIVPTEGSEHALRKVSDGEIDLAFVQGGLVGQRYPHVTEVAPLHLEPLHLLVKSEVAALIKRDGLAALGGKEINTGSPGSGTHALSTLVLKFVGLRRERTSTTELSAQETRSDLYLESQLGYEELLAIHDPDKLPDAIFSISSLPSTFAKEIIERHGYELVELPFSDAFALDAFDFSALARSLPEGEKYFDQSRVFPALIPAFTYSVRQRQPPKELPTIGTRLLLVAHDRVPDGVIERLLAVVFDSALTKNARPPVELDVMKSAEEFPWHAGAQTFIAHHKPLIAGAFVELTANGLAIIGSVVGGTFFLIQWLRRRRQNSNEAEFRKYLTSVLEVERELLEFDEHASLQLGRLVQLHQNVIALKRDVANRFFNGELDGQALMLGFMTMANDVRSHIARLIMHERDNVEDEANQDSQSLESLWNDRMRDASQTSEQDNSGQETNCRRNS